MLIQFKLYLSIMKCIPYSYLYFLHLKFDNFYILSQKSAHLILKYSQNVVSLVFVKCEWILSWSFIVSVYYGTFTALSCPLMSCNELPRVWMYGDTKSQPEPKGASCGGNINVPADKTKISVSVCECVWKDFMGLLTDMFIPAD